MSGHLSSCYEFKLKIIVMAHPFFFRKTVEVDAVDRIGKMHARKKVII
jgi:hypothetical protein